MGGVDICILVGLLLPAVIGVIHGFLNIIFSIIAWILALGISIKFGAVFSPLLENYIETELFRDMLAFVGLFIISLMLFSLIGYFIVKLLGRAGLTAADRILGFFFGFVLGGAIITVIVFLAGFTAVTGKDYWHNSLLIEPFQHISVWGSQYLPEDIASYHRYQTPDNHTRPE